MPTSFPDEDLPAGPADFKFWELRTLCAAVECHCRTRACRTNVKVGTWVLIGAKVAAGVRAARGCPWSPAEPAPITKLGQSSNKAGSKEKAHRNDLQHTSPRRCSWSHVLFFDEPCCICECGFDNFCLVVTSDSFFVFCVCVGGCGCMFCV